MYGNRKRKILILVGSIVLALLVIVIFLVVTKRVTNPISRTQGSAQQFFVDLGSLNPFRRDGAGNEGGISSGSGAGTGGGIDRGGITPGAGTGSGSIGGGTISTPSDGGFSGSLTPVDPQTPLPLNTTPGTGGGTINPCITNPRDIRCAQNAQEVRGSDVTVATPPATTPAAKDLILTPEQQRKLNDIYFAFYRFSPGLADETLIASYDQDLQAYQSTNKLVIKEGGLIDQCVAIINDDTIIAAGNEYNLVGRRFYGELYPFSERSQFALGTLDGLPFWKFDRMYDTNKKPYYMTYTHTSAALNQPLGWLRQGFDVGNFIKLSVSNSQINESEGQYFGDTSFILPRSRVLNILLGSSILSTPVPASSIEKDQSDRIERFWERRELIENTFGIY